MVVNAKTERPQSSNCIFQPELRVDSENNGFSFVQYSGTTNFDLLDAEEQSLELQYRNKHVYGTGLGTRDSYAMTFSRSLKFRPWISHFRMIAGSTAGHCP